MILSLLKILFFFAVVLAVTLFAVNLSETGDALRVVFAGTEYTLGPIQTFIAIVVLALAGWLAFKLLGLFLAFIRFLAGDQTAIDRYFARSRQKKGYQALADGMLAVASGEGKLAQDKAAKAAKYLNQPHITDVLAAQAAEAAGDVTTANEVYRRLLGDDRTRFLAVRGLMRQKLTEGDTATALKLAEKAYALKPRHQELQDTLLQLQTQEHDWKGARGVLKDKRKQGQLPQDVHIRRDAVLALQEASEVLAHGNSISAREAAISANRASPDLIPAAVLAARSYIAQKDFRNASRVLQKTWSVRPHPSIAATYAEIVPDETPQARLKRFEDLMRKNPDHEETRLLRAELNLAAENFPEARRALGDLASVHPTTRSLSIMAAVERGEGADDAVVRGWLARALTASRGPQWLCDKCHNVMSEWAPVCDSCGGFDTLTWREPDEKHQVSSVTGAEMLPLLVGRPAEQIAKAHDEADAYAEGAEDSAQRVTPPAPQAEVKPGIKPEVRPDIKPAATDTKIRPRGEHPVTAPGMVPRESDWVSDAAPSSTVTVREETVREAPAPARMVKPQPEPDVEILDVPVRPDVEPPEDLPRR